MTVILAHDAPDAVPVFLLMRLILWLVLHVLHPLGSVRSRNFMFGSQSGPLRDFAAQLLTQALGVIGVNLCIIAPARDGHIREPAVDEVLVGVLRVHVNKHPVGRRALAAVAGHGIAVVDMRVLANFELHVPS